MAAQRYGQYKAAAVEQADPVRLVGMLYEGALRFTELGRRGIADGDAEGAHNAIMRAYAIVAELLATLDFEQGGEISKRLEQLYDYVLHLLREANLGKSTAKLDEAEGVLRELAGAWEAAFRRGPPAVGAQGVRPPAAGERRPPLQEDAGLDAPPAGRDAVPSGGPGAAATGSGPGGTEAAATAKRTKLDLEA